MEYIPVTETGGVLPCYRQYHTRLTIAVTPAKKNGCQAPVFAFLQLFLAV